MNDDSNKKNIMYFENRTMRGLFEDIEAWQNSNMKRLLSTNIEKDGGNFCCIALSNPTEVKIVESCLLDVDVVRNWDK